MKKNTGQVTRRGLLQAGAGLALGGVLADMTPAAPTAVRPSVYEALGVKHVINATGTVTNLGGSLMPPEVAAAWVDASRHFVNLLDLQAKVCERIAGLIGVEAALVTTGAAGALLLGTAAVVTRGNRSLHSPTARHQGHEKRSASAEGPSLLLRQPTDEHWRQANRSGDGGRCQARRQRCTALMFFMNVAEANGRIQCREWLKLAKQHQVPTLLDAAADVPPLARLSGYNRMGFDLVAFSGGKAMRGPNDTGLLLGSKALIEAGRLNANPHCGTIGRMMKVSKEDMVALLAAVERFVKLDHKAEWREYKTPPGRHRNHFEGYSDSAIRAHRTAHRQPCAASTDCLGRKTGQDHARPSHSGTAGERSAHPDRQSPRHRRPWRYSLPCSLCKPAKSGWWRIASRALLRGALGRKDR